MSISGGPRRLAGLQRTPAAYANEAALAISGRAGEEAAGARGPGSAPPGAAYIAGSALPGAQVRLGGPEPAGAAAAPAQGAGSKLWRRPRGAVSAGAPGSPLYRVSAPPPAPRAAPPRRRPAAPPGESGRGQGSGRRLCLPGARAPRLLLSGTRRAARPRSSLGSGPQLRSACQSRSGSGAPSLRTFSSGS